MRYEKGLSLLEVLVAFAILAIVLTALLRVFGTGLRNSAVAEASSQAAVRAESVLASAATVQKLTPGEAEGDYGDGYRWRRIIRPFSFRDFNKESATMPVVPYEIVAEVSWTHHMKQRTVRLATLRLAPRDVNSGTPDGRPGSPSRNP